MQRALSREGREDEFAWGSRSFRSTTPTTPLGPAGRGPGALVLIMLLELDLRASPQPFSTVTTLRASSESGSSSFNFAIASRAISRSDLASAPRSGLGEIITFPVEGVDGGSISMLAVSGR